MAQYRIPELGLSTRCMLGLQMLRPIPERGWAGRQSWLRLMASLGRCFINFGIECGKLCCTPWRHEAQKEVWLDKMYLRRAITVLSMLKGSVRGIQLGLDLLFNVRRSVGYVSETLQKMGLAGVAYNVQIQIPLAVLGEADEIFQGRILLTFPPAWQPVALAYWEVLSLSHRSSSPAESLHSWLRHYLQIHQGMPQWLLPLLTLLWNHHLVTTGIRTIPIILHDIPIAYSASRAWIATTVQSACPCPVPATQPA